MPRPHSPRLDWTYLTVTAVLAIVGTLDIVLEIAALEGRGGSVDLPGIGQLALGIALLALAAVFGRDVANAQQEYDDSRTMRRRIDDEIALEEYRELRAHPPSSLERPASPPGSTISVEPPAPSPAPSRTRDPGPGARPAGPARSIDSPGP